MVRARERKRERVAERGREREAESAGVLSVPHSVSQLVSMRIYYINDIPKMFYNIGPRSI